MKLDECTVTSLEAKTQCHLFSKRCVMAIAEFQWERSLPEPGDWRAHDEATAKP